MYSNNGTNFKGAVKVLGVEKRMIEHLELSEEKVMNFAMAEGFQRKFYPQKGPHFNGLAEAAVKSGKSHLLRVTKGATLTFEEYSTIFYRISAMLNSRLIAHRQSPDQDDYIITPAHFLIGRPMYEIPRFGRRVGQVPYWTKLGCYQAAVERILVCMEERLLESTTSAKSLAHSS